MNVKKVVRNAVDRKNSMLSLPIESFLVIKKILDVVVLLNVWIQLSIYVISKFSTKESQNNRNHGGLYFFSLYITCT
jgi:hypothetical protein